MKKTFKTILMTLPLVCLVACGKGGGGGSEGGPAPAKKDEQGKGGQQGGGQQGGGQQGGGEQGGGTAIGPLFTVQQQKNVDQKSILGVWELDPVTDDEGTSTQRMRFEADRFTRAVMCAFAGGKKLVAEASAKAKLDSKKGTIEIIEAVEKIEKDAVGNQCDASITKATYFFEIKEGQFFGAKAAKDEKVLISKKKLSN